MICIVCKSEFLAYQISSICMPHVKEAIKILPQSSLLSTLTNRKVSIVFFDSNLFVDTAAFRKMSPNTRFIVIASTGEEKIAEKAVICGAYDFLLCPFSEKGVINCL